MEIKKKILVLNGISQYDVLETFRAELVRAFEVKGYLVEETCEYDGLKKEDIFDLSFSQYEFIFCINFVLLTRIAPYIPASTVVVSLVVDHPMYHKNRFTSYNCLNLIELQTDRYRVDFASQYYPFVRKHDFLPHGGSMGQEEKPFTERKYNIVMLGSYQRPDELMGAIIAQREMKDLILKSIELYLQLEMVSVDMAISQACKTFYPEYTDEQIFNDTDVFFAADKFIRAYVRSLVVDTLLQSDLDVHVFGNGWENYNGENRHNLHIHSAVSYNESLNVICNTKIILNVTPTLNNGSHERIFSSMLNGAVCFTTRSLYLEREGLEQDVIQFSISDIADLPQMVRLILENPLLAQELTHHAKQTALENHLWKHRADSILDIVKQCKTQWGYCNKSYSNFCEMEFGEWCDLVRNAPDDFLFETMKHNLFIHKEDSSRYLEMALRSYNHYGFWGKCDPEKGNYELFHNRIKEIREHFDDIVWLFGKLGDYESKCILNGILRYWLDYFPPHLEKIRNLVYDQYFDLDLISCDKHELFVDAGGYHGETVLRYIKNFGKYQRIICYEVFEKNMDVCKKRLCTYRDIDFRQYALGDVNKEMYLNIDDDVSACQISNTGLQKCNMVTLDDDVKEKITFLKMDIEGSEYIALKGAERHIKNDCPKLAIACYHGNQDIYRLARLIWEINPDYQFYLRYYGGILYPSEYVLYGICP